MLRYEEEKNNREQEKDGGVGKPKVPEIAYLESRAIKLLFQQVFQHMPEENLTLFEDSVVTAQAASIFLE